jgi:hypothetical protein
MAIKQNIGDAIFSFIKTKSPRGRKEMFGWLRANAPTIYIYKTVVQTELLLNHLKKISPIIYNNN